MKFCIGVQFVNRRLTMTGMYRVEPYRFFNIVQNQNALKRDSEQGEESIFFSHTEVHPKYLGTMQS